MEETEIGEVGVDKLGERVQERAREAGEQRWIRWLALSTAVFAVIAAIASLQSGQLANESLLKMNQATLKQAQASDKWSYYQAKGVKLIERQVESDILAQVHGSAELIRKSNDEAQRYKSDQEEIRREAEELEKEQKEQQEESTHLLERHHRFAYSVTLLQVAIGLSAVAAIVSRKSIWLFALLGGAGGVVLFAAALLTR